MSLTIPLEPLFDVFSAATGRGGRLDIAGFDRPESRSYEDLLEEASRLAAGLAARGIEPGDRVGVFGRTSMEFALGCLSLWRRGAVVVPLPVAVGGRTASRRSSEELSRRCADLGIKTILVTGPDAEVKGIDLIRVTDLSQSAALTDEGPALDDTAVIQLSSGSTGRPRAIALTHRSLVWHLEAVCRRYGPFERDEEIGLVSWLPMFHDMGLVNYFALPMALGNSVSLLPTEMFVMDPLVWLTEISRHDRARSSAPNFGFGLAARRLQRMEARSLDLSGWEVAGMGGEPVREETLRRFSAAAAPFGFNSRAFAPAYGLAEATCAVTATGLGKGARIDRVARDGLAQDVASPTSSSSAATFVSAGPPLEGVDVSIRNDGEVHAERSIGEICVRGPSTMEGYVGDPAATAQVMIDGWLRTGDRGYMADGELFVTGRVKDMIIVNGLNYYAEDIESVAETVEGVRRGACVAIGVEGPGGDEALVLVAEGRSQDPALLERCRTVLKTRVWAEAGLAAKDVVLVEPGVLPKTSSGKLQRSAAKRMYEEGRLARLG